MQWRKFLYGAFWAAAAAWLLLKVLVFAGKGWVLFQHLPGWWPDALTLAVAVVIVLGLYGLWTRKTRQSVSG
jgi:hypothetical protein